MKMFIDYYDRKKDKFVSKEYKSKAAFIKCLQRVPSSDTYTVIYNDEEYFMNNSSIIKYIMQEV